MSKSGKLSRRRRLMSILAIALFAGGLGAAFGSAVRFQVIGSGEAAPLFKPQQDFPPLAKWPPEVSIEPSYQEDFDRSWQGDDDVPELVYKVPSIPLETETSETGAVEEVNSDFELETATNGDDVQSANSLGMTLPAGDTESVDTDELPLDEKSLSNADTDIDEFPVEWTTEDSLRNQQPLPSDNRSRNHLPDAPFPLDETVPQDSTDETWNVVPGDFVD